MSTLLITIVPSILILLYFFLSDKFKEPKGSIALVFFLGICICLPAGYINFFMENNFKDIFSERLLFSFLGPAWCEELLKFIILYYVVLKRSEFNEPMDGIVYGVAVSLGFATLENFYYVYGIDWEGQSPMFVAWVRTFSAVPMHALAGCFMGYFFMKYSFVRKKDNLFFCFFIPFLLHGFYNLFASINTVALYGLLIIGWVVVLKLFGDLKKLQKLKKNEYEKKI